MFWNPLDLKKVYEEETIMWYFYFVCILFVLSLFYRLFANIEGLVFGILPAWMTYIIVLWLLMIVGSFIFALKYWKLPEED